MFHWNPERFKETPAAKAAAPARKRPQWRLLIGAGLPIGLFLLSGCAPTLGGRRVPLEVASLAATRSIAATPAAWPTDGWWTSFGDRQLDALESEALANSPTLRQADARTRQADVAARVRAADNQPQLGTNAQAQGVRITRNQGYPDDIKQYLPRGIHSQGLLNLDLSWQLNFFGRNRAAIVAARSDAEAAHLDQAAARLFLSTAVATNYADLNRLFRVRAAAAEALAVRRDTLALMERRFRQGLATRPDADQEATFVPTAEGELLALDRQIAVVRYQLAALVGAGPDRGLAIQPPTTAGPQGVALPASLPLDLVGRRPDLLAARTRIEAADRRVTEARRAFYPNINLAALAGVQSFGIANLFTNNALVGTAGPAISLPIFQGGRLRTNLHGTAAAYDEQVATYDGLLIDAIRDVADVVAAKRSLGREIEAAERARSFADNAYGGMRRRYVGGLTSHLDVLTAENGLIAARRTVADLRAQSLLLDIALIRALGGGFAAPAASDHGDVSHG